MSYTSAISLMNKGIARPTLYNVSIPNIGNAANDHLNLFCKATSVPGISVNTIAAAGQEFHGIVREQVTEVVYEKPFTITVISDKNYIVYKAMRDWFNQSALNANQVLDRNQRVTYYNELVRDFTLSKLEYPDGPINSDLGGLSIENYDKPFTVKFINAYIVNIGAISLASDAYDTALEFDVSFTYESHSFRDETIDRLGR